MKPLIVLLAVTTFAYVFFKVRNKQNQYAQAARIGIATMFLFTALGHFLFPSGMALMIPKFIPFKTVIIYITAIFEIGGALALLIPSFRRTAACLLILFLLLVLPANINAAIQHLNYQTATYDGDGLTYLWFRIPLQFLFILWLYWSTLRQAKS